MASESHSPMPRRVRSPREIEVILDLQFCLNKSPTTIVSNTHGRTQFGDQKCHAQPARKVIRLVDTSLEGGNMPYSKARVSIEVPIM